MADGSVKIDVGLDLGKAEKDLAKLKAKIEKAEAQLNADASRKTALQKQIAAVGAQADEATRKVQELKQQLSETGNRGEKASIRAALAEATEEQRIFTSESNRLNDEYVKVSASIDKGTQEITEMKEQAGDMVRQIESSRPGEAIAKSFDTAKKSLVRFLKYAIGIRSVYILCQRLKTAIKDAVKEYAEYDKELKYNLALMDATKKSIRVTAGSALASIYTAILPIVQRIANWMLEAANAAAKFIAILSGKSSYKRAVVNASEVAASLAEAEDDTEESSDDAGELADNLKEAKKQVLGFDELNILGRDSTASDSEKNKKEKEKIDKTALDGITMIDEAIDAFDDSFINKLALSVKDVLFDWSNLNPEQIAEKAIAGLAALLSGAAGFILGGVPGAITGTLLGLTLGLIADSAMFDHDGVLDRDEVARMLKPVLNALVGGAIGFSVGGFKGALLGATIGFDLSLIAEAIKPYLGDKGKNILDKIVEALNYAIAGYAGIKFGLLGGGVFGLIAGLSIAFLIDNVMNDGAKIKGLDEWIKSLAPINNEDFWGPIISKPLEAVYENMHWAWEQIKLAYDGITEFLHGVFTADWSEAWEGIKKIAIWAFTELLPYPAKLLSFISNNWKLIKVVIAEAKKKAEEILDYLTGDFEGAITEFFGPILGAPMIEFYNNCKAWWNDIKPIFEGIIDFLAGVFTGDWERTWKGVYEIFYGIFSTLDDILKSPINNIIRLLNKAIVSLNWLIDGANKVPGVSIPKISEIPYLAKGGILKRGQIGFLEGSGDEAVVPLEKNTEWMSAVADGLMERLTQMRFQNNLASAIASTPRPAMASGGIVPPGAITGGGLSQENMQQAIERGVYNAIMALGGMPKSRGGLVMNVNGREFMRATYDDRKAVDNEHGISLIETR